MHRPEVAGRDARRKLGDERKEAVVLADRRTAATQRRLFGELLRSEKIAREWLLAHDVLFGTERLEHQRRMEIVRGGDVTHVDGRIAQPREINHRRGSG